MGHSSHLKNEFNVFRYGLLGGAESLPMKQWGEMSDR